MALVTSRDGTPKPVMMSGACWVVVLHGDAELSAAISIIGMITISTYCSASTRKSPTDRLYGGWLIVQPSRTGKAVGAAMASRTARGLSQNPVSGISPVDCRLRSRTPP